MPVSKARGRKAAIRALLDQIEKLGVHPEEQTMIIYLPTPTARRRPKGWRSRFASALALRRFTSTLSAL